MPLGETGLFIDMKIKNSRRCSNSYACLQIADEIDFSFDRRAQHTIHYAVVCSTCSLICGLKDTQLNHVMEIKIYYEDTDCGGVVYYANYLRYMERARTEYMASCGASVKELMDQGYLFVIGRVEVDYRSSARYGDTLVIETWFPEITAASFLVEHTMKEKNSRRLIAECKTRAVCVDKSGKPTRIPKDVSEKLRSKDGSNPSVTPPGN